MAPDTTRALLMTDLHNTFSTDHCGLHAWQYADGALVSIFTLSFWLFVIAPQAIRWPEDQDGRLLFKLDRIGP